MSATDNFIKYFNIEKSKKRDEICLIYIRYKLFFF